ncbi:hypothetical protein BH10CYA1_BH10CYA1_32390 [soil metagenome]
MNRQTEIVAAGSYSGIVEATNVVVRTRSDFKKLWAQHQSKSFPPAPLPRFDFRKDMIIAVFAGTRNSGGWSVEVKKILTVPGGLSVQVAVEKPKSGASMAISQPFCIVGTKKINRSEMGPCIWTWLS